MKLVLKALSCLSITFLVACGGGGSDSTAYTVTSSSEGTSYSCPTKAKYDACTAGSCTQCTCISGCDVNAPKAKLKVAMAPTALTLDQPAALSFTLSNDASVNQTVAFSLSYPAGTVTSSAVAFSSPCITSSLSVGAQKVAATVTIPAKTLTCTFEVKKRFSEVANPVLFSLSNLDKLELEGLLPIVSVTQP